MGTEDKNDLEFSDEELSDLEQSRSNRSSLSASGRPRRKSHHKGLRIPADVVPRQRRESEPEGRPHELPPRKASSRTLPLGVPSHPTGQQLDANPTGQQLDASPLCPPTGIEDTERISVSEVEQVNEVEQTRAEPEEALTEPFLSALPLEQLSSAEVPISVEEPAEPAAPTDPPEPSPDPVEDIGATIRLKPFKLPLPAEPPVEPPPAEADVSPAPEQREVVHAAEDVTSAKTAEAPEPGPPQPTDELAMDQAVEEEGSTPSASDDDEDGDTIEIPPPVVQKAVQEAIKAATEAVTTSGRGEVSDTSFDIEDIAMPGAAAAMEELSARQTPSSDGEEPEEEEGERANRVAILLGALQSPAKRRRPTGPAVEPDETPTLRLTPLRPVEPQSEEAEAAPPFPISPFPLAEDLVSPPVEPAGTDLEELSGEDLEEVSTEPTDGAELPSPPPPPIPDPPPLSPFVDSEAEAGGEVRVPVREPERGGDDIMTSAMPDEGSGADSPAASAPSAATEGVPAVSPTPVAAQAPAVAQATAPAQVPAKPAVPPPAPVPAAAVEGARVALARGRKRKKAWFEEIFDEDWLRTLKPVDRKRTAKEVDFLEESLQPSPDSEILDLGCGVGRQTIELASRGYKVTGFDLSLPLLIRAADEAQRRNLQVNFVHGDFRELSIKEQFDAVYCLATTFGYFDDDSNRKMIHAINQTLRVGGRFLLDVVNRDYAIRDVPARIWWEGQGSVVLEEVDFNYFTSRIISKRSVVFEDGRHLEQEFSVRAYSLHELGKILHHAGFRVLEVSGDIAHRARFFGNNSRTLVLLAEKRAQ